MAEREHAVWCVFVQRDWDHLLMVAVTVVMLTVPSHVPGCVTGEFLDRPSVITLSASPGSYPTPGGR